MEFLVSISTNFHSKKKLTWFFAKSPIFPGKYMHPRYGGIFPLNTYDAGHNQDEMGW